MTDPDGPHLVSTGIGSWPGTAFGDAVRTSFAECTALPFLPELPARGPHADLIGRGTAFLTGLGVELHPSGWRLTDVSAGDHRRAVALLRSDLDQLEEAAQGYAGPVKLAVAGPWTLAAHLEHPRGDKVLADAGARRDLTQSLAEGVAGTVAELARRLPDVQVVIQLDEPSLPAVLAGAVPTASGLHRHRVVDAPEVSAGLTGIVRSLQSTIAPSTTAWVHCCASEVPVELLAGAGVGALLLDVDHLTATELDQLGSAMESGLRFGLGVVPAGSSPTADQVADRALAVLRRLNLNPAISGRSLLTPACGLASSTWPDAVGVLRTLHTAARLVSERLLD